MAGEEEQSETLTLGKRNPSEINEENEGELEEEDEEESEIEELEREVKEMAEKVLDSRRTVPVQLMEALSSHLAARRPAAAAAAAAGTTGAPRSDMQENSELDEDAPPTEADQAVLEKLRVFKAKAASNIAAMPVILKRMNECIASLDKLEQYNVNIHSAFKRRK